jgi:hypothetical protein
VSHSSLQGPVKCPPAFLPSSCGGSQNGRAHACQLSKRCTNLARCLRVGFVPPLGGEVGNGLRRPAFPPPHPHQWRTPEGSAPQGLFYPGVEVALSSTPEAQLVPLRRPLAHLLAPPSPCRGADPPRILDKRRTGGLLTFLGAPQLPLSFTSPLPLSTVPVSRDVKRRQALS